MIGTAVTKRLPDALLGAVVEQIAFRDCSARATPFLIEAAHRLQRRRRPPWPRRLLAWLTG